MEHCRARHQTLGQGVGHLTEPQARQRMLFSSAETPGAGPAHLPDLLGGGELGGVPGETSLDHVGAVEPRALGLGGPLDHAGDEVDVDGLGLERPGAGQLHPLGPHFFTSPRAGRPGASWSRAAGVSRTALDVDADRLPVAAADPDQVVDVTQGVGSVPGREVLGVGGAADREPGGGGP